MNVPRKRDIIDGTSMAGDDERWVEGGYVDGVYLAAPGACQ